MKNRIPLAATCLRLLAFISFASTGIALIEATKAVGRVADGGIGMLLVPLALGLAFGFAFLHCAKFLKRGSAKAWKWSIVLLVLLLLKAVAGVLLIGFLFDFHWRGLAFGAAQVLLPGIGLWALLQAGSRAFVRARPSLP